MSDFYIRTASEYDAYNIARIHVEGWQSAYKGIIPDDFLSTMTVETFTGKWLRNIKEERSMVLVAEKDEEILGFISGGHGVDELSFYESEVYALYIDVNMRSRGIGTALLKAFFLNRLEFGFSNCAMWVLIDNPYRRFCDKNGGKITEIKREKKYSEKKLIEVAYEWKNISL